MVLLAGLALLAAACTQPPPEPEPAPEPRERITLKPLMPPPPPAPAPAPPPRTVRLVGVGDIMMGTNFPNAGYLNPDLTPGADLAAQESQGLLRLPQPVVPRRIPARDGLRRDVRRQ
jgi:hypothetical protein